MITVLSQYYLVDTTKKIKEIMHSEWSNDKLLIRKIH